MNSHLNNPFNPTPSFGVAPRATHKTDRETRRKIGGFDFTSVRREVNQWSDKSGKQKLEKAL